MAIVVPTPNTTITSAWGKSVADALNLWTRAGAGAELVYAQITASVSVTNGFAGAQTFVDGGAATYDGSPVIVEAYCPYVTSPAAGVTYLGLWDGATFLTQLGSVGISAGQVAVPVHARYRLTPTAASHAYKIGTWLNAGPGPGRMDAGGAYVPGFIRVTRA